MIVLIVRRRNGKKVSIKRDFVLETTFATWIDVPIIRLETDGIHTLLREIIPCWPRMGVRHCTKNLKMLPQRDYFDLHGYDQVRKDKRPAQMRDTYGNQKINVIYPAPLTLAGECWAESTNRASLPIESRDDVIMRMTHRPVLDWTIEDIWEFIFWMKAPYNTVYTKVKRVACAGCVFANPNEIRTLGEHNPEMLERWVETERVIGHPWKKSISFRKIYEELKRMKRLGIHAEDEPAA